MAKKPTRKPATSGKKKNTKKAAPSHKKWVRLFWLFACMPVLALTALLLIARFGALPNTEELANPKTNLATEVVTADNKVS